MRIDNDVERKTIKEMIKELRMQPDSASTRDEIRELKGILK